MASSSLSSSSFASSWEEFLVNLLKMTTYQVDIVANVKIGCNAVSAVSNYSSYEYL